MVWGLAVRALLTALSISVLAACSDGEPGDLDLVPHSPPSIVGNGSRLSELNALGPQHPANGTLVSVTGVSVLWVDEFDETSNGSSAGNVYAEDLPIQGVTPPYGGITLFDSSFNPPTLRVGPGDVVDIRGTYEEFAGPSSSPFSCLKYDEVDTSKCLLQATLPEIVGGAISLRFEGKVPEPVEINLDDLAKYETGRQWLGMLVRVKNVKAAEGGYKSSAGRYSIRLAANGVTDAKQLPTLTNALFDLENSGVPTAQDTVYPSVVGIVQYFYNFQIAPRSAADFQ